MKNLMVTLFFLAFSINACAQFFNENFSTVVVSNGCPWPPPNNWTSCSNGMVCWNDFEIINSGGWICGNAQSGITSGSISYSGFSNNAIKCRHVCDAYWSNASLTSPWIDCRGQNQVLLTFVNLRAICYASFSLSIIDSGFANYTIPLGSTNTSFATFDTIDITPYAYNRPKIAIDFHISYNGPIDPPYIDSYATWIIDDIKLTNTLCNISNDVSTDGFFSQANQTYGFCNGDSIKLFLLNPLASQSFQWFHNGVAINGKTDSLLFTTSPGEYTCQISDTCGFVYTKTVHVIAQSPLTPIISYYGSTAICPPSTGVSIFTGASSDGFAYQWYKNNSLIAGASDYSYWCTTLCTYHASVTNSCGTFNTDTVNVFQGTAPVSNIIVGSPYPTCYPTPFSLLAFDSSAYQYQWFKSYNIVSGATNSIFSDTQLGNKNYYCEVTDPSGCTKISNTIYAGSFNGLVANISALGPTTFCLGDSVVLQANQLTSLNYQWLRNNMALTNANSSELTAFLNGSYTAYVSDNLCTSLSNSINITTPCAKPKHIPAPYYRFKDRNVIDSSIQIFNNQTNQFEIISEDEILKIGVVNCLGINLLSYSPKSKFANLNLPNYGRGLYFLQIQTKSTFILKKIILN
ncbi:MAG TPA: hypothetical protein PKL45_09095 [Bacteroidia bacterium]|nr:hypothetical protein [Bacteroidia bacterium]